MTEKLLPFDASEFLDSQEAIECFMREAFETGDAAYIAHAIGVVARAKSMSAVAKDTGLSREQLYRSFSGQGNPTLRSLLSMMDALGLRLAVQPVSQQPA